MKKKKEGYIKTVLTISTGFSLIFLATGYKWALIVSICIGLLGIISEKISRQIDCLWMKLAGITGCIIPNIVLALVFYLCLFPLSALSKILGKKDSLNIKNRHSSLWQDYNRTIDKEYFEKIW